MKGTLIRGSDILNPSHSAGGTGQLFPDATLSLADGGSLSIDSFRPCYDLVILMRGAGAIVPAAARLLDALARDRSAIEAEDGQVLVVVAADPGRVATDDVLQWLTFINIQCPECSPPEW